MKGSLTVLALLTSMSFGAYAQEDFEVFDSEQIDVDGLYKEKPKPSRADKIRAQRQALEKSNEDLVRKKIEDQRIKEEERMTKRLENMFQGKGFNAGVQDSVTTGSAAPAKLETKAPELAVEKSATISVGAGITNLIVSENEVLGDNDYSSDGSFTISADGIVSDKVEMGVGITYNSLSFEDEIIRNGFYGPTAGTYFGGYQPRNVEGSLMTFDIHGKYYFTRSSKLKPFVGAQGAYNRVKLEYSEQDRNQPVFGYYPGYEDEQEYSSGFFSAGLNAGIRFDFTDTIGLIAQGQYNKNFGSGDDNSDNRNNYYQSYQSQNYVDDQKILDGLGGQIEEAHSFNLNIGISASF